MEKIKVIIFHYSDTDKLSYLDDWLDAFRKDKRFIIEEVNLFKKNLKLKKIEADFYILLHSALKSLESINVAKIFKELFLKRRCKLLAFVADEVNLHITPLSAKINFLKEIEPDFIGTQLPLESGKWLYEEIKSAEVLPLPHALNPEIFKSEKKYYDREYDIGIISVPYPIYLGDNERNEILNFFEKNAYRFNLKVNIIKAQTKSQRLSRKDWANFLNNCKGTASSEAGSYYLERDDKIVFEVMDYLYDKLKKDGEVKKIISNNSSLWKIWNILPYLFREFIKRKFFIEKTVFSKYTKKIINWDGYISYDESLYQEVFEKFFKNKEKNTIYSKAISSRHFEAIGTKTIQILFEGRYNDILKPDEHYLSLKKDFSNIKEVIERFKDKEEVTKVVENAYSYVIQNHTYKNRLDTIYEKIVEI